jgi:cytochrome c-type biogenesis protein CcmH
VATLLMAFALITQVAAQGDDPTKKVSDDQVNAIARKMYCPVCENIPLDTCPTLACSQWREEIRAQIGEGKSEQQIIDDFVNRFGDRVVGTPIDPLLRALSLVTPWLFALGVVAVAVTLFNRWRKTHSVEAPDTPAAAALQPASLDDYRQRLEQDLVQRYGS